MAKLYIFLCIALIWQVQCNIIKGPRDLVDEARQQLEDLNNIVKGTILAAVDKIDDLDYDFLIYGDNMMDEGTLSIEAVQASVESELVTLRELVDSKDANISYCIDPPEEILLGLPHEHIERLKKCISNDRREEANLLRYAKYVVDIAMSEVHNIEFQFRRCGEELLCISPLLTEIELNKIRLPQNIDKEVLEFETLLSTLKLSINSCSDSNISSLMSAVSSIFRDITSCIDKALDEL